MPRTQLDDEEEENLEDTGSDQAPPAPTSNSVVAAATHTFTVEASEAGLRADRFLADRLTEQTRTALGELFSADLVTING